MNNNKFVFKVKIKTVANDHGSLDVYVSYSANMQRPQFTKNVYCEIDASSFEDLLTERQKTLYAAGEQMFSVDKYDLFAGATKIHEPKELVLS